MFCNSTITDLFLFVFTQLILHYRKVKLVINFLIYLKQYYTLKLSQYLSVNYDTKHRFKINDITSTQKFYTDTSYFFH